MNIKKAFTKLAYISAGRDCDSYMSLNEMRMILEALDEPPESIGEISSRFYNENRQLKINLDLANADIETFNKEIERLKEVITALQKMPSGLHMFQKLQDERDKLYGEICIANGLVKNLEEKLKFKEDFKYGFVSKTEYEELNADCYKKRDRIDKYFASCEKIREILSELNRTINDS